MGQSLNLDEFSKNLADVIQKALIQGFDKAGPTIGKKMKEATTGGDFVNELKDQLDLTKQRIKEEQFNAQVRKKVLNEDISTRQAELEVLNRQKQAQNNKLALILEEKIALYEGLHLQQMTLGNLDEAAKLQEKINEKSSRIQNLKDENKEMDDLVAKLKEQYEEEDKLNEARENSEEFQQRMEEVNNSFKSMIGLTEEVRAQLESPQFAKAAFAGAMHEKLVEIGHDFHHFKEQGLSAGQAVEAQFKSMSIESMLGLSDAQGAMDGFIQSYGRVGAVSSDVVNQVGKIATTFGISGQEAAKLNASLSQMSGETSESSANAMEKIGKMAESQGIAGGAILNKMAGATEEMARAGGKGAEAFGESVINLHKMGVEMSTASKIADGLLDFESSINAQQEASVLLGRSINLDKARELALNNDLEGATKEVLKNVGGSAEFGKLNRIQQDALAKSAGMTVEELSKAVDAQEEQNKYFGEGTGLLENMVGYAMKYGGAFAGFLEQHGVLLFSGLQLLKGTTIGTKLQTLAEGAWNTVKTFGNKLLSSGIVLWIRDAAVTLASKIAKGVSAFAEGTWNVAKRAGNAVMQSGIVMWIRDTAVTVGSAAAKRAAGLAEGVWNAAKAAGNFLMTTSAGLWVAEKIQIIASTAAKWLNVGATTAAAGANTTLAGAQTAVGTSGAAAGAGATAAGGGLAAFAAAATPAIPVILAIGAALLMASPALFAIAEIIKVVAQVIGQVLMKAIEMIPPIITAIADGFVKVFTVMAENWKIIIPVGIGLLTVAAGMVALGSASAFAAPGLFIGAIGLSAMLIPLAIMGALSNAGLFDKIPVAFQAMAETAPAMALLGNGLLAIGAGLSLMAIAGLGALPVIGALITLAAVAPALTALGDMLGMGGGEGGGGEDDKMQILIDEIRGLRAEMSRGGEVKMDGKKVGEVLRLAMNTSGIR